MDKDEALRLALEALGKIADVNAMDYEYRRWAKEAITAIKEALAQPKQEPVEYTGNGTAGREADVKPTAFFFQMPPQRKWVGLDAFDRMFIRTDCTTLFQQHHDKKTNTTYIGEKTNWDMLFEAIEAKLREKNG